MTVSLTDGQGETVQEITFETEVPQVASGYDTLWNIPGEIPRQN